MFILKFFVLLDESLSNDIIIKKNKKVKSDGL